MERISAAWVAARQIRTPDRALEQDIAHQREARWRVEEHHVSRRMSGTVQHLELHPRDIDRIALDEPAVGRHRAHVGQAELARLILHPLDQRLVRLVRPLNRHAQRFRQLRRSADMVDMAVGDQDAFDLDVLRLQRVENGIDIAARIDDDAGLGLVIPKKRAVLGEGRDGNDRHLELGHGVLPGWKTLTGQN